MMPADTLIALAIVAAAVGFLVRRAWRSSRARKAGGPGCDNCPH
ncbi:MAG: FeoB-associated Cys-rich membrane protein [Gemmatimonadaceae bacterium]|nr:FeoB-associated Cys-rich membrane protein [Gemmatimonadaceae bacterium]